MQNPTECHQPQALAKRFVSAALFALSFLFQSAWGETIAFVGGRLIDGNGGPPVEDSAVVIKDGTILAVGEASAIAIPKGAKIIAVKDKSILPGIIDAHMHIGGSGGGSVDAREFTPRAVENNLIAYLKFGVTTVYDMAAHPTLSEMKSDLESGRLMGPRLYGNGLGITAPGSHPIRLLTEIGVMNALGPFYFQVRTKEEAVAAITKVVAANTDGIKIFHSRAEAATTRYDCDRDKLSPDVLQAAVGAAHNHGKRVYAHISFPSEAKDVVEAGADVVVHSIGMAETGADEVLKLMAEKQIGYIPTLAIVEGDYALDDARMPANVREKVWGVLVDSIRSPESVVNLHRSVPGLINDERRSLEISMANLRTAVKANVKIAMGTDAGNAGLLHGATVVRELELMNEAGMSPMQVIVAATKNAADVIGQGRTLGTIESGKTGDLIVVAGDPVQDVSTIANVEMVVKNGTVFDPRQLRYRDVPAAIE
jgi:imidazolonepropionase-like amidohydrolase